MQGGSSGESDYEVELEIKAKKSVISVGDIAADQHLD